MQDLLVRTQKSEVEVAIGVTCTSLSENLVSDDESLASDIKTENVNLESHNNDSGNDIHESIEQGQFDPEKVVASATHAWKPRGIA